ncbi:MAG: vWA domain-containing protein [Planctomycetota bacterium]
MRSCWSNPYLLLLAPLYGAALWAWWRRQHSLALAFRRRTATKALLHAAAALSLLLAAAGLQVPAHASRQTVVAVADVSASVFDLSTQSARLSEALAALDPQAAQAAIVIFGRTAGLERALSPLARDQRGRTAASPTAGDWYLSPPGAVDLARPATIVDRSATDIGSALNFARGLFPAESGPTARAILLLSDFRDTCGSAGAAAAALSGSGIDLLACPAALGPSADVRIDALNVPLAGRLGRDLPVEVTVAAQSPATVRVAVWKKGSGAEDTPVDFKTIALAAEPGAARTEIRRQVRVLDRPASPGVAVYTARVSAAEGELPGDITLNNELSAAVRITGVSRWAVLTRAGSTLAQLCADKAQPLGVEAAMFTTADLPRHVAAYDSYAGILVDGLSAAELPEGPALRALAGAVDNGKALVALGGEQAFGAGGHREGAWEQLLPVEMTPEDDRTRAVLFIMDVSKSMEERMGRDRSGVRKIDFASEQLALAVQKLRPPDRLGMIAFSGAAELVAPLSAEPGRSAFLAAVKNLAILSNTDLVPALRQARVVLNADNAEEQLVVLLSDGVQTVPRPEAEILQAAKDLCPLPQDPAKPRRPVLCTFGIDVDAKDADPAGEKLLKGLAAAGGGKYFPEFLKLGERLEQALIGAKKDFYVRREPFVMRPAYQHPLLAAAGIPLTPPSPQRGEGRVRGGQEAVLPFRLNSSKPKMT